MPEKNDKSSTRRKMQKRVETKEDGRLLIYYTFEESASEENREKPQAKPEAVRK